MPTTGTAAGPAKRDRQLDAQAAALFDHDPFHHETDHLLALGEVGRLQPLADGAGESLQRGQDAGLMVPALLRLPQGGAPGLHSLPLRPAGVHAP